MLQRSQKNTIGKKRVNRASLCCARKTYSPSLLQTEDGTVLETRDDLHHGVKVVEIATELGRLDHVLQHLGSLLERLGRDDLGRDPVTHLVEALDHGEDVGRARLLVLLGPRLVEALPGLDLLVELVLDERQLARELLRVNVHQRQRAARGRDRVRRRRLVREHERARVLLTTRLAIEHLLELLGGVLHAGRHHRGLEEGRQVGLELLVTEKVVEALLDPVLEAVVHPVHVKDDETICECPSERARERERESARTSGE